MTSDKEMCKDFEDSGAVFPKVTPERIEELMKQVRYIPSLVEGTTTTLVVSVLPIGLTDFTLATATMACVDKRNFNAELGVKYCIEKCEKETRNKLWELEGYALANRASNRRSQADRSIELHNKTKPKVDSITKVDDGYYWQSKDDPFGEDKHTANEAYEYAYKASVEMSFGMAIEAARLGHKVARKGWNGTGMFAYIVPANSYPAQTEAIKGQFDNDMVPYREYWAIKTAQNDVTAWQPSGSDSLANDWVIYEG